MNSGHLLRVSELWFRLLLRLYPPDFRDEMGEAFVETYRDRAREALESGGASRLAIVSWGAFRDSLRNGLGERVRPVVAWRRAGDWGRDLERVSRRFARNPMFVIAMVGTLSVGLGTFAVVYTAVDKILLEPLPYPNPGDLYMVWHEGAGVGDHFSLTGPAIVDLQKASGVIEGAAGMQFGGASIPAGPNSDASPVYWMQVSPNVFDLLGVQPVLGRGFRPEETGPNAPYVGVLTDRLWKRLGGDSNILGTPLRLSNLTFTVIGVMPPNFQFNAHSSSDVPDMYIPLYDNLVAENPNAHDYRALIRARRSASAEAIRNALGAVSRFTEKRDGVDTRLHAVGLQADIAREVRPALVALSFAVVFLLLVLLANLASLLLARAAEREREFAVSRAVGGSTSTVVRATLIEGGMLGLLGGIAGTIAAIWGLRLLTTLAPSDLPRHDTLTLDWGIAAVVIAVGLLLGFLAAAVPAVWAARVSLPALLANSSVRGGASSGRMRRTLIVAQVAFSLVLLSAGGLVVRSFERLLAADPGFHAEGVLTLQVALSNWLFSDAATAYTFQDRVIAQIRALPGVTGVSATTATPLNGGTNVTRVSVPSSPANNGEELHDNALIDRIFIRPGYIETMGMRLRGGRDLGPRRDGVHEALIDRHLAEQFFPKGDPIGATAVCEGVPMTIVGVVDQARLYTLHADGRPQLFVRADDYPDRRASSLVIRTGGNPRALIQDVRTIIRNTDRRVPVTNERTMVEIVADRRSRERISAVLISGLALGALLLVAMGLFGVISGSVARRRGELALRIALGATHGRVIWLVVGEGTRLLVFGLLLAIPGIYMSSRAIQGLLVGVSPFDTPTIVAAAIIQTAVALLACYLAARRVTTIEPERLLREG